MINSINPPVTDARKINNALMLTGFLFTIFILTIKSFEYKNPCNLTQALAKMDINISAS